MNLKERVANNPALALHEYLQLRALCSELESLLKEHVDAHGPIVTQSSRYQKYERKTVYVKLADTRAALEKLGLDLGEFSEYSVSKSSIAEKLGKTRANEIMLELIKLGLGREEIISFYKASVF